MASLVQVATELQAKPAAPIGTVQVPVDTSVEKAFSSLSDDFASVGKKIGAWADHAAANEGAQTGHLAGLDPEFRPGRTNTIRGDAFDKAGLQTYTARTLTALQQDLQTAADKHQADPAGLKKAIDAKTASWLANTLPDVRPEVELAAGKIGFTELRQATRAAVAEQQKELAAATQLQLAQDMRAIQQRAMKNGINPEAAEILASDYKRIEALLTRRGPNGHPLVGPQQARLMLENLREDVTTAQMVGTFDRLPSLEAREQFVASMRNDFEAGKGLPGQYNLDQFRKAEHLMRSELNREKTEEKVGTRLLANKVAQFAHNAEQGIALPDADMRELQVGMASARDPKVLETYQRAAETLNFHQEARRQTPQELDRYIEQQTKSMRAEGAPAIELHKLEVAKKLRTSMAEGLQTDSLGWAANVGLVQIPPLTFVTPGPDGKPVYDGRAAIQSLQARAAVAETVGEAYGRDPQYFRPAEAQALQAMAAQGPQALTGVATSIVQALGPEKGLKALAELGKHAPEIATLGGMAATGADPKAINDAAAGMALRRVEGFKTHIPNKTKSEAAAGNVYGNALAALPSTRDALIATAEAIYEVQSRRLGKAEFDETLFRKALRSAAGEVVHDGTTYGGIGNDGSGSLYGGRPVVVPGWLRQDSLRDAVKSLTVTDLTAAGGMPTDGDGRPVDIKTVHRGRLVSVGHGRYAIAVSDPDGPDPHYLGVGRAGAKYILDLNQHRDALRQRLPQSVLGGR